MALRWQDVDWSAGVVRVRRSLSRGQLGTPKSRRSSRAVPLADRVAAELERLYQGSPFQDDADIPGGPLVRGQGVSFSLDAWGSIHNLVRRRPNQSTAPRRGLRTKWQGDDSKADALGRDSPAGGPQAQ